MPITMVKIQTTDNITCWSVYDATKKEFLFIFDKKNSNGTLTLEDSLVSSYKLNMALSYEPIIPC